MAWDVADKGMTGFGFERLMALPNKQLPDVEVAETRPDDAADVAACKAAAVDKSSANSVGDTADACEGEIAFALPSGLQLSPSVDER